MHRSRLWPVVIAAGLLGSSGPARADGPRLAGTVADAAQLPEWQVPDVAGLPDNETTRLVRYGRDLINHTTALIGPDAQDSGRRFSGNGLECTNCHLNAGTTRFGLPLVGIAGLYPKYSARTNGTQDLADRVNDCMQRSMNGRALPTEGREMRALVAYLTFLGSDTPAGVSPVGRGAPPLPLPTRAADPQRGASVYQAYCAACHQTNGLGVKLQLGDQTIEKRRYVFPPLWGPDSYNDGAGMARIVTGAWFVHANMPNGIRFRYPLLAADEAYDVMAFVNTQPRPRMADLAKDYPDLWLKPVGSLSPPWAGHFSAEQNRFGPWQPILAWRAANPPPAPSKGVAAANDLEQHVHAATAR